MRILLVIPPMNQLNTPYPSIPYLAGFLTGNGYDIVQMDASLALFLELFSKQGIEAIAENLNPEIRTPGITCFKNNKDRYAACIGPVIRFLQGKDPSFAYRIVQEQFLPRGPRFGVLEEMEKSCGQEMRLVFGALGIHHYALYRASLFIDDIGDVINQGIDDKFALSRYGESLTKGLTSCRPLIEAVETTSGLPDRMMDTLVIKKIEATRPDCVGITVPFPGSLYGALRVAKTVKKQAPDLPVIVGGGYINTELRSLRDESVFKYIDYITFDDGEEPFLRILESIRGEAGVHYVRTAVCKNGTPVIENPPRRASNHDTEYHPPEYGGLPLSDYVSFVEMPNPMHTLWSQFRWNKIMIAHGCYWAQCSFCDTSLPYINRFEPAPIDTLVDSIERIIDATGQTGFHFVDEACPPAQLKRLAEELMRRKISINWWGNIRFEKSFTPRLVSLLARSGCIAISGGLEAPVDRLLRLLNKGITLSSAVPVMNAFSSTGIMVHAYLMYGIPTQTKSDYVNSLERIRQLFLAGFLHSAYWHRFSLTIHSPMVQNHALYGIKEIVRPDSSFALNDIAFTEKRPVDHELLGEGLKKALYNYMHGLCLLEDVRSWFSLPVPKPTVAADEIAGYCKNNGH